MRCLKKAKNSGFSLCSLMKCLNSILFSLLILVTGLTLRAEAAPAGSIGGKVADADTKEGLPAVNVIIEGTVLGTSTDLEGNFILQNIPEGNYTLQFIMMGYQSVRKEKVIVEQEQKTNLEVELSVKAIDAPEMVVTASKRAQNIEDSPSSISVVTSKDIERRNYTYLDQLLEYVSGVNFMGNQINIRGSSGYSYGIGSRVMFLVDGVPVMSGDKGEIKWDFIPADQIERVEIVKSAGSALYGSTALGGVVNVITKEPALKPETGFRLSGGFYDDPPWPEWKWSDQLLYFNDVEVNHSRKIGETGVYFSMGHHHSTGYRQNGDYNRVNASGKVKIKISPRSNLLIAGNWQTGKNGIGLMWRNQNQALEVIPPAVGDYIQANNLSLHAIHQTALTKSFGLKDRVSFLRNHFENFMHDNDDYSTAKRYGLELQAYYLRYQSHTITFGTELIYDNVSSNALGGHDIYTPSVYAQDEIHIEDNMNLTLGARFDYTNVDSDLSDNEFSPKLGYVWHVTKVSTIKLSTGKGFRAPSISERFPDVIASGLRVIPNLELMPETAWSNEISFSTPFSRKVLFDIAAFRNDYWDLIEPVPDITNTIQFTNITRARISGLETTIGFSFVENRLSGQIGYTFLNPQDLALNQTLAYRPKHLFNGSVSGRYHMMELGFDYRYYDKLEVVKVYPRDDRVAQQVLDARFSIEYGRWIFSLNANNLFNHMHTQIERTIMSLRHYRATVRLKI
jgi:outer membrane receptor for ferrienterochelin and colicins